MKNYTLIVIPLNGETKTYDAIKAERHELVNSDGRTFINFYVGETRTHEAIIGQTHTCLLSCKEVEDAKE